MKKLIAALLIVLCVFPLAACGGSDTPASEATDRPTAEEKTPAPAEPKGTSWERYIIGVHDYCLSYDTAKRRAIDVPRGSYSTIGFHGDGHDCILLYLKEEEQFSGDAHAALENNNDGKMLEAVSRHLLGDDSFVYASHGLLSVTKEEAATVNGIETVRFEGTAGENGQHFVYGYAFVFDGVPSILFGIVMKTAEREERIATIKAEVDAMMQTVKHKK